MWIMRPSCDGLANRRHWVFNPGAGQGAGRRQGGGGINERNHAGAAGMNRVLLIVMALMVLGWGAAVLVFS